MKKNFVRLMALVLALVMCFGMTALAADPILDADKATITLTDGLTGATVTFTDTTGEKIEVTYESTSIKEGQFYLVMVVAETKDETTGETVYSPTKETILYINQTTGETGDTEGTGKIVFGTETDNAIYPSSIKNSAILIYGSNINGDANSLIAAIIDAKYVIGDANGDGKINVVDLTRLAQYLVGSASVNKDAADANGDGTVNVLDITRLAQYLVGAMPLG